MACKVSSGAMFTQLLRAETTCTPDLGMAQRGRPQQLASSLARDLSQSLSGAGESWNYVPMKQVRTCLQAAIGAFEAETATDTEKTDLVRALLASDLPATMIVVLPNLEFEAQKEVMRLFHQILQGGSAPVIDYVRSHKQVLQVLLEGCRNADVALYCHMMLRSCALHSDLVVCMLEAGFATELLKLAQHQVFDISSDAFASLRELLLTHKSVAATYLEAHFKDFFVPYNQLLQTEDYVTKRQALRLLAEILLDSRHKQVMRLYVGEEPFLQVQMNLLRENSRAIQGDAFHVFKVFAASPKKRLRVHQILFKNRERLVKLLESLGNGKDDAGFQQDRDAVIQALWTLEETLPRR